MKLSIAKNVLLSCTLLYVPIACMYAYGRSEGICIPLTADDVIMPECVFTIGATNDTFCNFRLRLDDGFKGCLAIDRQRVKLGDLRAEAVSADTTISLNPMLDMSGRICEFVSEYPLKKGAGFRIQIPAGLIKAIPDFEEVEDIDIDEDLLSSLSVAGAWHKAGTEWSEPGMFSVIDDDSLDGQIKSSKHNRYTYGYYSLLYPLLESLGLKGSLAVEGRKIGIDYEPPYLNDNGKTLVRLQDEKGWSLLCHSMDCLGEDYNNWIVDSLESPLAREILAAGPNKGISGKTVSVYDMKTRKQYWPDADNSGWEETPARYVKPYAGDYSTKKYTMYNPDYDIEWHWGEWKRRSEEFGFRPVGFVTHNSTSSHALVPDIRKVFPDGLSDIGWPNINYPPMFSSGVRSGLEGQSMAGYDGNSTDNTFNEKHYKKFCEQVDEAVEKGGWIVFNLHTYRDCWNNSLPGMLVSEGGTYPDEWVIPMKGMDSANDPLTPPAHLGIKDWSEWYPCPGTRLEMMWKVLKYAKEKGLKGVTCAEGFKIMGNRKSVGYYNGGNKFGMDRGAGLMDTEDIYPHYVVSATGEVSYFNPVVSEEYSVDIDDMDYAILSKSPGKFMISGDRVMWSCPDPSGVSLRLLEPTGKPILSVPTNNIILDKTLKGVLLICALRSGVVLGSIKMAR